MSGSTGTNTRLDSWKDIASYLRRDVRTVIRWEKQKGLPVRRVPGGQRKSVFAYTAELDSWLSQEKPQGLKPVSNDQPDGTTEAVPFPSAVDNRRFSSRSRLFLLFGLIAAMVGVFLVVRLRLHSQIFATPIRVGFTPTSFQAFGEQGQLLWTYRFDAGVDDQWEDNGRHLVDLVRVADFRGDGQLEILAPVPLHSDLNYPLDDRWEVDLFSSGGKLLWSYVPQWRFQFGKYGLGGPWLTIDALVTNGRDGKKIWLSCEHPVWGNSFVVNLDPVTGKDSLRFVNTGSTHALAEVKTTVANYLLVGGFNNEPDTGSLAVINETKAFAASPQSDGSRHKCVSCPAGNPDYYFVFPRSEINEFAHMHEDAMIEIRVHGNQMEVRKLETHAKQDDEAQTIYSLQAGEGGLRVTGLRFGSGYDMVHRRLEKEGKIDHTLENCPERLHPRPVRVWTPAVGWDEIKLEPTAANQ